MARAAAPRRVARHEAARRDLALGSERPGEEGGEVAGQETRVDEHGFEGGEQAEDRSVLLVLRIEVVDDVLEQEVEQRAAVVDADRDLETALELGQDEIRTDRLRRVDVVPLLDRPDQVVALDDAVRGVAAERLRQRGEQCAHRGELRFGKLELPRSDELVEDQGATRSQGAAHGGEGRAQLAHVMQRHVHQHDVERAGGQAEAVEIDRGEREVIESRLRRLAPGELERGG